MDAECNARHMVRLLSIELAELKEEHRKLKALHKQMKHYYEKKRGLQKQEEQLERTAVKGNPFGFVVKFREQKLVALKRIRYRLQNGADRDAVDGMIRDYERVSSFVKEHS